MSFTIKIDPIPLEMTDGVIQVSGTRVTLDSIIMAFNEGATAEEIASQYPVLPLADIYAVISYYLSEESNILKYLNQRQSQAKKIRNQNEFRFDPSGIRERLLSRQRKAI